jgi:50S ribosomal protein L4
MLALGCAKFARKSIAGLSKLSGNLGRQSLLGAYHLPQIFASNASRTAFSSASVSADAVVLPPNLKIDDLRIIQPPKPLIDESSPESRALRWQYQFPLLPSQVPSRVAVKSFSNPSQSEIGNAALESTIFTVPLRKDIIIHLIRYIRHRKRQPKKTKRMSELRGSNKKPRPQKGSGTSQVGHRRNSAWRGGQKAFGPVLRDYSICLNKKVRAWGYMMTLAAKLREGNLLIVDNFNLPTHRTKDLMTILKQHGLKDETVLLADVELPKSFNMASQNIPDVVAMSLKELNAYEILRKEKLVLTQAALVELQERLMYQYTQGSSKRKKIVRSSIRYEDAVKEGIKLLAMKQGKVEAASSSSSL